MKRTLIAGMMVMLSASPAHADHRKFEVKVKAPAGVMFCYADGPYGVNAPVESWGCHSKPKKNPHKHDSHLVFIGTRAEIQAVTNR